MERTKERLVGDLKTGVREAEDLMEATAGQTGAKARELRERLAAAVESAKAAGHRLEEKTIATVKATDQCIREHPYQTIGVAFGLGVLIGVLISRRR